MKVSLIIEARTQSTRLPEKILKYCYKRTTFLEYLVKRLKNLDFIDNIIIATTNNIKDKKIVEIGKKLNVDYYIGSEHNVLERVLKAAKKFNTELIIRVTSDCPLTDLDIISQAYKVYLNNKVDYVSTGFVKSYPLGMDVEIFSYKTLKKSYKHAKDKASKEFITFTIRRHPNIFKHINLISPKSLNYPNLELTLDYFEDLLLLKKIIKHFWNRNYNCIDIINFLKKNNKIAKINATVKRTKYNYNLNNPNNKNVIVKTYKNEKKR